MCTFHLKRQKNVHTNSMLRINKCLVSENKAKISRFMLFKSASDEQAVPAGDKQQHFKRMVGIL